MTVRRGMIGPDYRYQSYSATTDDQGQFVVERVCGWPGGLHLVERLGPRYGPVGCRTGGGYSAWPDHSRRPRRPGPAVDRPGIPALSPDQAKAGNSLASIELAAPRGWLELVPAEMPCPPDFMTWNAQETTSLHNEMVSHGAGKSLHAQPPLPQLRRRGRRPVPD